MKYLLLIIMLIPLFLTCSSYQSNYTEPDFKVSIFSPPTKIPYSLKTNQKITVILYNLKGEILDTIASGEFAKGQFEVTPVTNKMESGVYFIKLIAEDTTFIKKIMVLK